MQIDLPLLSSEPVAVAEPNIVHVYAGKLFDPVGCIFQLQQLIQVDTSTGRIYDVVPFTEFPGTDKIMGDRVRVIDCRRMTIVPGFVDVHVHLFLHPYSETSWNDQLITESITERTIRASNHARRTLMAGFTAVRDLGTEGAGDVDVALRKCLTQGLIPGPRYFCASKALVSTGSYGPKSSIFPSREGVDGISGAEVADGIDDCVKVVRRQIGAGADWIKIYADYRVLSRLSTSFSSASAALSLPTFSRAELEAMIKASHSLRSPSTSKPIIRVAAHATNYETIKTLLELGIDSVEHGTDLFGFPQRKSVSLDNRDSKVEEIAKLFDKSGAVWVPTLAAYYTLSQNGEISSRGSYSTWERGVRSFQAALSYVSRDRPAGSPRVRIAVGGDTGVFAHGDNSLEMKLMVRLGADWRDVLKWATICGWGCITGNDPDKIEDIVPEEEDIIPFGTIRRGWAADLVGLAGDMEQDGDTQFETMIDGKMGVKFVMKAGKVYRWQDQEFS